MTRIIIGLGIGETDITVTEGVPRPVSLSRRFGEPLSITVYVSTIEQYQQQQQSSSGCTTSVTTLLGNGQRDPAEGRDIFTIVASYNDLK